MVEGGRWWGGGREDGVAMVVGFERCIYGWGSDGWNGKMMLCVVLRIDYVM